ncbi:MAG: ABC transporter ATP-binding protein [Myxococcota bacterium]
MSAIRARGLTKTFRSGFLLRPVPAVRGVDLEVREGEIFGFIGPNGSGKTTTIKMLAGLIHPTRGEAWIHDIPVSNPRSRTRLGFLPEGTYFHDYLTGREFLRMHLRLVGAPRSECRARADELLERVGLSHAPDLQLRRYSKGMRQRVGLAQALAGDPSLVILDEPMSGLDPIGRKDIRDLILALREEGKTVFFSSHILADAEMICDQVAILLHGQIRQHGYLHDLLGQEILGIELVVEGLDEGLWQELSAQATRSVAQGPRHLFEFGTEQEAEKALDRIREAGARLRSFTPRRRSLEDLLLEGVREERAS